MAEKLISVIVPIYKVEDYLRPCIDSIREQTYHNLEILLVDDGSPDNCPAICDEYAREDSRIRVIHKPNGGLSDARNAALEIMQGEYVCFVDSDDMLQPESIAVMYRMMIENDADLVVNTFQEIENTDMRHNERDVYDPKQTIVLDRVEAFRRLMYQVNFDNCVFSKLYRSESWHSRRFPKGKLFEDIATVPSVFDESNRICYNPYKGYLYRLRPTGIELSPFTRKKMDLIDIADNLKDTMLKKMPEAEDAIWARYFRANCHVYLQIPVGSEFEDCRRRVEANIRSCRGRVLRDRDARMGSRIAALYTYLGFTAFRLSRKLKGLGKR